jgi:hypothetical protein
MARKAQQQSTARQVCVCVGCVLGCNTIGGRCGWVPGAKVLRVACRNADACSSCASWRAGLGQHSSRALQGRCVCVCVCWATTQGRCVCWAAAQLGAGVGGWVGDAHVRGSAVPHGGGWASTAAGHCKAGVCVCVCLWLLLCSAALPSLPSMARAAANAGAHAAHAAHADKVQQP